MKNIINNKITNRRSFFKTAGTTIGVVGLSGKNIFAATPYETSGYAKAMAPVTIKNVKAIGLSPNGRTNLIVVKVETSEPGLYGLGCATFTQRALVVKTAIESYMNDFCVGKDVDNIEDMWQSFYVSSYWRNGPVLNNAISGLDQALWDIKGKRANMPVYQLLGGKCRFAVDTYSSVGGSSPEEVADNVSKAIAEGQRYVRVNNPSNRSAALSQDFKKAGFGRDTDSYFDARELTKGLPKLYEIIRKRCGDDIELCSDIHEKLQPVEIIPLCREMEQYRPFFIEDPLSPENRSWWPQLRASTIVPFAMGELFNNVNEFIEPVVNHYFDYMRIHVSQMGGITPCMKVARLCEWFNVKTIWHGPGDCSPVGHAAQAHMDMAIWNFGLQEGGGNSDQLREIFPGAFHKENGYIIVSDKPGLGVDIDEKLAAKYPITNNAGYRTTRLNDGTVIRP